MKKYVLVLGLIIIGFLLGYGVTAKADFYGRDSYVGYFDGRVDYYGGYVFAGGIPDNVNTANEFISFIMGKLNNGSNQDKTGAAFLINVILQNPAPGDGHGRNPSQATINAFKDAIHDYANNNRVNWNTNHTYLVNSYYQDDWNDDAFYADSGQAQAIVFYNSSGGETVAIKRVCSNVIWNPLGGGTTSYTVFGDSTVAYNGKEHQDNITLTVAQGSPKTVVFKHYLWNSGTIPSSQNISWRTRDVGAQSTVNNGVMHFSSHSRVHVVTGYKSGDRSGDESYIIRYADIPNSGKTICRRINYKPTSSSDSGWGYNGNPICVKVKKAAAASVSCTAAKISPAGRDPNINENATIQVRVTKTGSGSIAGYYVQEDQYPYTLDTWNLANVASQVSTDHGKFVVSNSNPRGSPTITYTYLIYDSAGNQKASCGDVSVTWYVPPPVKPYFKVTGGDVFTGGWFNGANGTCDKTKYQAPDYKNIGGTRQKGGIYAFAGNKKGASSQYAALATGSMYGDESLQYGFYTHETSKNTLSFANSSDYLTDNDWGGLFEGTTQQTHCVNDYFGTSTGLTPKAAMPNIGADGKSLYKTAGVVDINSSGATTINKGQNTVVYIEGNVYISHNIVYTSSDYQPGNAPKFALVVKGDIYIDPGVSRLDGLYIAQPNSSGNAGVIWTCHGSGSAYSATDVVSRCKHQLTFNGAVIARQMNLWRVNDGLNAGLLDNPSGNPNIPAEIFNYTPEMVISSPLIDVSSSSGSQDLRVESVISLPPIF